MQVVDVRIHDLSVREIRLLDNMMQTNNVTTEKSQVVYLAALGFYLGSKKLARLGMIECMGRIEKGSNEKQWIITETYLLSYLQFLQ